MNKITITAGDVSLTATLNDSQTSQLIWDELPIISRVQTWGDEIYFRYALRLRMIQPRRR